MRAILIEEERFTEITDILRTRANEDAMIQRIMRYGVAEREAKMIADEIHRSMHFYFVRWAQSHGASCTK